MSFALLSDVHGNLEALDAVLADVDARAPGACVVCAGDIVGDGPDPEACLDRLLERGAVLVRGHHEELVLGWRDDDDCAAAGVFAVAWTRSNLSARACATLAALPAAVDVGDGVVVCHGDLDDAGSCIDDAAAAARAVGRMHAVFPDARVLVCGHTHHAMCFSVECGLLTPEVGCVVDTHRDDIINPGAVGQTRTTQAPLASWALLDVAASAVVFHAVPYAHELTTRKLKRAGLRTTLVMPAPHGIGARAAPVATKAAHAWLEVRESVARRLGHVDDGHAATPVFPRTRLARRGLALAQRVLHATGASRLVTRRRRRAQGEGALILAYHGVTSNDDLPFVDPRFAVPVAVFARQMEFLARERTVLSMSELVDHLERNEAIPPQSVVITFDDGYLSTQRIAAPILKRLSLPAIVYLPTGQISREQPQFIDVLYGAFNLRTRHRLAIAALDIAPIHLLGHETVMPAYLRIADALSYLDRARRDVVLADVVAQLRPSHPPPRLTMGWQDVRELRRSFSDFEVGVHTRDHLDLTACDEQRTRVEVDGCIADLHIATGEAAQHFSFPYGRSCDRARRDVQAGLLRSAVVTEPTVLVRRGADPFHLARMMAPRDFSGFPFFTSGAWPDASLSLFHRA